MGRLRAVLGRIWLRLLLVNVVVVLVPVFGLEFARIYEKQLLFALERDMNDQASLTRAMLEEDLRRGVALDDGRHGAILESAARRTRTRIRVLDPAFRVVADSHGAGAPEGPEPDPPHFLLQPASRDVAAYRSEAWGHRSGSWPSLDQRREVRAALQGTPATETRLAHRPRSVFLFSAIPVSGVAPEAGIAGAVYVTRSTTPVLMELHRIRASLFKVLVVTLTLSVATTLLLALSISHPLTQLSKAAGRIAGGERGVPLPVYGSGEIAELSRSFRTMTEELDRRLVYISEFSADVAHEFKSPLTSIRGAAELLAEGAHENPEVRARFLQNILLDTERLDRLVTRLLLLSRIEASAEEMTLVDLRALLDGIAARAESRGPLELSYSAKHTWVRGRAPDLETALSNLVENAQRYSPAGHAVIVGCDERDGGLAVDVTDHGPGIPAARRSKIFERFYTTDGDSGGTGLGLAIVDSVARAHGGRVEVDTEVGRGSRFTLWLPRPAA